MQITISLQYYTKWGERLAINLLEQNVSKQPQQFIMNYCSDGIWSLMLDLDSIKKQTNSLKEHPLSYYFTIVDDNNIITRRESHIHTLILSCDEKCDCQRVWVAWNDEDTDQNKILKHQIFSNKLCRKYDEHHQIPLSVDKIIIYCKIFGIKTEDKVYVSGNTSFLGNWQLDKAIEMTQTHNNLWYFSLDKSCLTAEHLPFQLKLFIKKKSGNICWAIGQNIFIMPKHILSYNLYELDNIRFDSGYVSKWGGIAIPLFSLRSDNDFGIGDFGALRKLVDFVHNIGLSIIQLLPIYDTTYYLDWRDSYPYNAISTVAINPLYLDLNRFDIKINNVEDIITLRNCSSVDYDKVAPYKWKLIKELAINKSTIDKSNEDFLSFVSKNKEWLLPYACFYITNGLIFDIDRSIFPKNNDIKLIELNYDTIIWAIYWIQYQLHIQLLDIVNYAHSLNIILKGDLPIGVNPYGVEIRTNPELFISQNSAGAPPDDFARDGQNWGFPIYNWDNMKKTGYQWWRNRLSNMEQYFDALRIDHILGFFRIWAIPNNQISGLLGHFTPSLPLSELDFMSLINTEWTIELLSYPVIHKEDIIDKIGIKGLEIITHRHWVEPINIEGYYRLTDNKQTYWLSLYQQTQEEREKEILKLLSFWCTEVLFIQDEALENHYHPRICCHWTYRYNRLDKEMQHILKDIHDNFYYYRHNQLWQETAINRLKPIFCETPLLPCAEDLGMIPQSVPYVLNLLSILSLELERMPKKYQSYPWTKYTDIPYQSVFTTSTHDMPPLKLWWLNLSQEDKQLYIQKQLDLSIIGHEPISDTDIYEMILYNHLNSNAIFSIIPLGDLLCIFDIMNQEPQDEQINHPENPNQHWTYRFPFTVETLVNHTEIISKLRQLIEQTCRYK